MYEGGHGGAGPRGLCRVSQHALKRSKRVHGAPAYQVFGPGPMRQICAHTFRAHPFGPFVPCPNETTFAFFRGSQQSSCFNTPARGEGGSGSSLPPWVIPNARGSNSASSSPPAAGGVLPQQAARDISQQHSLSATAAAAGAVAMTAIPEGNTGKAIGGADLGRGYPQQRDGASADMTATGGGGGATGRRDSSGTQQQHATSGGGRAATAGDAAAGPPQGIGENASGAATGSGDERGAGAWAATDPESFLRESLSLKDLVSLAFMFNFVETGVLGLGEQKAVVQVLQCCPRRRSRKNEPSLDNAFGKSLDGVCSQRRAPTQSCIGRAELRTINFAVAMQGSETEPCLLPYAPYHGLPEFESLCGTW